MRTVFSSLLLVSLVMALCFSAEAQMEKALVLYLPFNEGSGDTVTDVVGGLVGKIDGTPEWTAAGKDGSALTFDGETFMAIPHDSSLDMPGAHTIAFWLKWDGQVKNWSPFICKRAGTASNYCTWIGSDKIWDYYTGVAVVSATSPVVLDNEWSFMVVTHDGVGKASFYVNGELDGVKDVAPGEVNEEPFAVGFDGGSAKGAGTVDEVALFNKALSANEIKTLMDAGSDIITAVEADGKLSTTWSAIKN